MTRRIALGRVSGRPTRRITPSANPPYQILRSPNSPFWHPLHRRSEDPRGEFGTPAIKAFALGRLARGGLEHQIENALAARLYGLLAVENGAAIDVHVVFHALEHRRVGCKLDRGSRLAAEHAAAPGGEADEIGAAGDLP